MQACEKAGLEGDNDLYGFGVRIGFYFQILALQLSETFPLVGNTGDVSAAIFYQLALTITLYFKATHSTTDTPLHPLEAHMELVLLQGLSMAGFQVWRNRFPEISVLKLATKSMVGFSQAIFEAWFYWKGMDKFFGHLGCEGTARTAFFFFAKVRLDGWYRTYLKVFNILVLARYVAHYILYPGYKVSLVFVEGMRTGWAITEEDKAAVPKDMTEASTRITDALTSGERLQKQMGLGTEAVIGWPLIGETANVWFFSFVPIYGFLHKFYVACAVELMIRWNEIEGVDASGLTAAGQLIPLILGIAALITALKNAAVFFQGIWKDGGTVWSHFRAFVVYEPHLASSSDTQAKEGDIEKDAADCDRGMAKLLQVERISVDSDSKVDVSGSTDTKASNSAAGAAANSSHSSVATGMELVHEVQKGGIVSRIA